MWHLVVSHPKLAANDGQVGRAIEATAAAPVSDRGAARRTGRRRHRCGPRHRRSRSPEWMAAAGADVVLCGRDGDAAARTAARPTDARHEVRVLGARCDVGRPGRRRRVVVARRSASASDGSTSPSPTPPCSVPSARSTAIDLGRVAAKRSRSTWAATASLVRTSVLPMMRRNGFGPHRHPVGRRASAGRDLPARVSAYVASKAAVVRPRRGARARAADRRHGQRDRPGRRAHRVHATRCSSRAELAGDALSRRGPRLDAATSTGCRSLVSVPRRPTSRRG